MQNLTQKEFKYGIIDSIDPQSLPRGASAGSSNWLTIGSKIELRRGYLLLGADAGAGRVSGLCTGVKADGTEVLIRSRGRKVEYYSTATSLWVEIGSDVLPVAADGEDISFSLYQPLYGPEVHWNSPNTGPYKIKVANPGDYVSLYDSTKNFKGYIKIKQNRTFLWNRAGTGTVTDFTGLYGSYIDKDEATDFTAVTAEAIAGAGPTNYTGTLAFKAGDAKRTCFEVTFTDTSETFIDDLAGNLVGSAGGTGTINYTTGAFSVTFAVATVGAVTATYRWENATSTGICDFTKNGTRTAGQGFVFRQDDGSTPMQNLLGLGSTEYCMHRRKTWALTLSADDTEATNYLYRDRVGIPNMRAAVETGEGVYYIDDTDESDPHFRQLFLDAGSSEVLPRSISKARKLEGYIAGINLADYRFNLSAATEYGDYILFACRHKDTAYNDTVFVYNKRIGTFDKLDYFVSCFAIYEGALMAGDSITNNVYTLFSGTDDDGSAIPNYWKSDLDDLDIENLKKTKRLVLGGEIGPDYRS
jgi:hypothetical protein